MKKKAVPALRFPEFREAGEWENMNLGRVCTSFSGGTPDTTRKEYYGGSIPFIRSAEINKEGTELFLTEEGFKNSSAKFVNKGDVLVALYGANSGDVALSKIEGAINQAILCLKSEGSNPFIYHFLSLRKDWIVSTYIQGGQGNLSGDIVKSINLLFPKPAEQQKLATFLTTLDTLISAEIEKLQALQAHKKGLMQVLFPGEGELVPRVRFGEFEGVWEEKTLGKVVKNITTGKLDANAMVENGKYKFFTCAKNHYWIDTYAFDTEALLIAGNGAYLGYIHHHKGKFNAYQRTYVLYGFDANVLYLKYYLERNLPSRIALEKKEGNTPYIVLGTITDAPVLLPTPSEQQKIAACLTALDALLTAQSEKIAALKRQKKGLMQRLFPNPNDETI